MERVTRYGWIALLLAMLGLATACEPDPSPVSPCEENETEYLSGELATMNYNEGSFWLMLDSVSDALDTLTVTRFDHGFLTQNGCESHQTEFYRFEIHSTLQARTQSYLLTPKGLIKKPDAFMDGVTIFHGSDPEYDLPAHVTTYAELPIGLDSFQNVSKCHWDHDATEDNLATDYYLNAEFGFLRVVIFGEDGQMLSNRTLLRCGILR